MSSNNEDDGGFGTGAVDSGFDSTPDRMTRDEAMGTDTEPTPEEPTETPDEGDTETEDSTESSGEMSTPSADDELYSPTDNDYTIPYAMFRGNAKMWRGKNAVIDGERVSGTHRRVDVFPETVDILEEVNDELNEEFESSTIHLRDTVELLLRAGAENLDDVKGEAAEWGFQK